MNDNQVTFRFTEKHTQRLDKYLVACLPKYSRSRLQNIIREGYVQVNGIKIMKTGYQLEPGSIIRVHIPPPKPTRLIPETIPLDVVYEDENVLIINKAAGMVVHPAAGHTSGTLVHAALAHAPEMEGIGGEIRPGVVHRLDKNTSGLILLAKNDNAHHWLQDQFRQRQVKKVYLALVDGQPPTPSGRIETSIGRDSAHRKQMAVVPPHKGRAAVSEYHTREHFLHHTLVEVHPVTGRTHQIRLHMQFIGCPIVGDITYGRRKPSIPIKRHFLHAYQLTITLPGAIEARTFEAPLPHELTQILAELRQAS